eukprot:TRINITY_DN3970_c0_g1_i1.p2 TRINITY_DN3970_c0_g1~~TRINITY_DN3970_c0_g1_i1.p2  ORF type:complete len:450 (-),score=189.39 TRINITY_DN3970_c0_g1_i1:447-1697(-)
MWQEVDTEYPVPAQRLEELFQKKEPIKKKKTAPERSASTRISVITKKRSQNMAIMLSRCKFSYADIALGIRRMDERISMDQALALLQFAPLPEEVDAVSQFLDGGDVAALDTPEQFIAAVMNVPHYSERLQSIVSQLQFEERYAEVSKFLNTAAHAIGEAANSQHLQKLLHVLLSVGNFVNDGTFRGGAWGFRLESLTRLVELRGSDRRQTLLHFFAEFLETEHEDVLSVGKQCAHAAASSKVGLQEVEAMARKLQGELDILQLNLSLLSDDEKYVARMQPFHSMACGKMAELSALLAQTQTNYRQLLEFFGEPSETTSDALLGHLASFLHALEVALEENKKRREQDEARKRIEAKRAERLKASGRSGGGGGGGDDGEEGGLMDSIIAQMRNGSAFRGNSSFSVSGSIDVQDLPPV